MSTKICTKCSVEKPLSEFYKDSTQKDKHAGKCKKCAKNYYSHYYSNNKEKILNYTNQWSLDNKEYKRELMKQYNIKVKETKKVYMEQYCLDNKEKLKQYRLDNKTHRNEYMNEYVQKRKKNDPIFKLKHNMRARLWALLNSKGWKKQTSTIKTVGCNWNTLKQHLETQFDDKMNWGNYGEYWEIDHILPLATAKTIDELYELITILIYNPYIGKKIDKKVVKYLDNVIDFRIFTTLKLK